MILLIDAGGIRSSAPLSSNTAPVSTSSISACFAWVSIPDPGPDGAGTAAAAAFGLDLLAAAATCCAVGPVARSAATQRNANARRSNISIFDLPPFCCAVTSDIIAIVQQRSPASHAVGQISHRCREIGRLVPAHNDPEVFVHQKGRPSGAVGHDQRRLAFA